MGLDIDQHRRSTLHNAVLGLLTHTAGNLEAASQVAESIEAVYSVIRGACADFSEAWNNQHAHALARRLPVEVMTELLRVSDLKTRIRASHVSRRWRAVALADCRLWTDFRLGPFSSALDQHVSLDRLEHILTRSRPLPLKLMIPYDHYGGCFAYAARVFGALRSEAHRLEEYDGPASVFRQETFFPALVSFNCRDMSTQTDILVMKNSFAAHNVPNLRRLVAPVLDWPHDAGPYVSLQHLVCHLREDASFQYLFICCPNLLTAEFLDVANIAALPSAPLPRSLQHVTLRAADDPTETAELGPLLQPWSRAGLRVPRVSLFCASLGDVELLIPIFLSTHNLPVRLITYRNNSEADIVMTSEPAGQFRWEIGTMSFWEAPNCFHEFRVLCAERLTALSVPLTHFWACCDVRTHAPHLVELEIRLAGREGVEYAEESELGFYLRAPQLRRVSLDIADSFRESTMPKYETTVFDTLDDDFRSLIVYDAELLDSIAVSCAPRHFEAFNRQDFSRFAKTVKIDTQ